MCIIHINWLSSQCSCCDDMTVTNRFLSVLLRSSKNGCFIGNLSTGAHRHLVHKSDSISTSTGYSETTEKLTLNVLDKYHQLVKAKVLVYDPHQFEIVLQLNYFHSKVVNYQAERLDDESTSSSLGDLFRRYFKSDRIEYDDEENANRPKPRVKSLYLYGGVGCGKTMLMDLVYTMLPETTLKQRIHFNKFMLNVHERIHEVKRTKEFKQSDPLEVVASQLLERTHLLFFDEFQVPKSVYILLLIFKQFSQKYFSRYLKARFFLGLNVLYWQYILINVLYPKFYFSFRWLISQTPCSCHAYSRSSSHADWSSSSPRTGHQLTSTRTAYNANFSCLSSTRSITSVTFSVSIHLSTTANVPISPQTEFTSTVTTKHIYSIKSCVMSLNNKMMAFRAMWTPMRTNWTKWCLVKLRFINFYCLNSN